MRRLQLVDFGEPSDVIELNTVSEPVLGPDSTLLSYPKSFRPSISPACATSV